MKKTRLLPFNLRDDEEVAEGFSEHNATGLNREPVEAVETARSEDLELLTIRITLEDMEQLKQLADVYGLCHTTMAGMLLYYELKNPRPLLNTMNISIVSKAEAFKEVTPQS